MIAFESALIPLHPAIDLFVVLSRRLFLPRLLLPPPPPPPPHLVVMVVLLLTPEPLFPFRLFVHLLYPFSLLRISLSLSLSTPLR